MKKVSLIVVVLVVLGGAAFYFLQQKAIVENPERLDIYRVVSYVEGEGTEITESVDLNKLADVLSRYQSGKIPKSFAPYSMSEISYEINATYNSFDPLHILVGDLNIVYGGRRNSNSGFGIKNSRMLLAEIDALINP